MSSRRQLVRDVLVAAPAEVVFAALVDWESQVGGMLATRVRSEGAARGPGGRLSAFTGVGRAGFAVVRPLLSVGVTRSLRRFAQLVEAGQLGRAQPPDDGPVRSRHGE